mgnify:CR=1 FL=1
MSVNKTKKQAAGLSALKNLSSTTAEPEVDTPAVETKTVAKPASQRASTTTPAAKQPRAKAKPKAPSPTSTGEKESKTYFSLGLPAEAHEKLRELSYHERTSITRLILEGVDRLFENRGLPPLAKSSKDKD